MTKNEITAKLDLALNLEQEVKRLLAHIYEDIAKEKGISCGKFQSDIKRVVGESDNTTYALAMLQKSVNMSKGLENLQEGLEFLVPHVDINPSFPTDIEVSVPIKNGRLTAYTAESDSGTIQTGTLMYDADNCPLDLTLSEIKKGDLAEVHGLSKNNGDIDVYVWSDPYSEDYTNEYHITEADISKAFGDKAEGKEENSLDL